MLLNLKCLYLALIALTAQFTNSLAYVEYFSSTSGLEKLLQTEEVLLAELKQYIQWTKMQLYSLQSEMYKIEKEHSMASVDKNNYLTNPVNAYRLIKRLHHDWQSYEKRVRSDNLNAYFLERLQTHMNTLDFPSDDDANGAAMGLVRLQDTYRLDVRQLAASRLNGIKYGNDMTWQDCFILGQQLYNMEDYNHTKVWLRESMRRMKHEPSAEEAMSLEYMEYVAGILYEIGDLKAALKLCRDVLVINPYRIQALRLKDEIKTILNNGNYQSTAPVDEEWNYYSSDEFKMYEQTCRGDIKPSATQLRPLRCRYVTNDAAYRRLAPFKIEEYSLDPLVFTVHDAISDRKINAIKLMATPSMHRSMVRTQVINVGTTSDVRVSKTAWLPFYTHRYLEQMLRDVHDLSGLNMTYSEELQVANYGLGGHFEPHWDFYEQIPDSDGDRIATAIFYLSDVEQGGATAFPYLQFAVQPRKGDMLFWYNLHRSLDKDYRTKHAGCPVLKGSKWIANVWIRDIAQTFNRPCGLQRDHEISLKYAVPE